MYCIKSKKILTEIDNRSLLKTEKSFCLPLFKDVYEIPVAIVAKRPSPRSAAI